jgi:hypothetical protein
MALLRSGENLLFECINFTSKGESLRVFSPFIRVSKLFEILNGKKCEFVVVRWLPSDILHNVTDFKDLFEFCNNNGVLLYRNPRIHLKVIQRDDNAILYGSANITNKGMGNDSDDINLELSGVIYSPEFDDLIYLEKILRSSDLVNESYFNQMEAQIEVLKKGFKEVKILPDFKIEVTKSDKFLLSSLPMSISPEFLWTIYSANDRGLLSQADIDSAKHDLINYNIPSGLDRSYFFSQLRDKINSHPFIVALKKAVKEKDCLYMGYSEVCQWLSENTTTDPNPRRWEIKQMNKVSILRNWICYFDEHFVPENRYPNGSDLIKYVKGKVYHIESVLKKLNRDKEHGNDTPYQIVLLLALKKLSESAGNYISLEKLKVEFQQVWDTNAGRYPTYHCNFGIPLLALIGARFLRFTNDESRYKFRDLGNEQEILANFNGVIIINDLEEILRVTSIEELENHLN